MGKWSSVEQLTANDLPKGFKKYYSKWEHKETAAVEFAKLVKTSRATLYRWIEIYKSK